MAVEAASHPFTEVPGRTYCRFLLYYSIKYEGSTCTYGTVGLIMRIEYSRHRKTISDGSRTDGRYTPEHRLIILCEIIICCDNRDDMDGE